MKNAIALVIATDQHQKNRLISHLETTGLFSQITPVSGADGVFKHLKAKPADMICWTVDQQKPKGSWIEKLQTSSQWHDLPLVAFADDYQSLLNGFDLGASDVVHLQADPQELSARIQRQLQRWQRLCELRKAQEELQHMALTDQLTRIGNRATFDLSMRQISARSGRSRAPYSLLLIDLDHFKKVNDIHGHQAGDMILQKVATAIQASARDADICCRYGGEEFAVILPDTNAKEAAIVASRIHRRIAQMSQSLPEKFQPVTVSIGIGSRSRSNQGHPVQLIEEADQALYRAKTNGRNRTEVWHLSKAPARVPFSGFQAAQMACSL